MAASAPRRSAGAVSAMYTGTTELEMPMATPATPRARARRRGSVAVLSRRPPTSEMREARSRVPRRPIPSASRAAEAVPATEPIVVPVTIMPISFGWAARPNSGDR
eukprot:scaffold3197_cov105-Isochrysis_galbana.AAC.6